MGRCCRRAQRRHGIADTVLGQRHDIHVAFNDDGRIGLTQRLTRLRQAEKLAPLLEQRCFRRIEVFRLALADHPATEGDDLAFLVDDWKHHAITETVVKPSLLVADDQSGLLQFGPAVIIESRFQPLPVVRRIADAETLRDFTTEAAPLEIINRFFGTLELLVVVLDRARHDLGQRRQLRAVVWPPRFFFRDLHADAAGQFLDRIDKTQSGIFHEKADRRPVRAATEAVVELLRLADGEGRCLLVVERAACRIVGPGLFQRHVTVDQVDNVDAMQQFLDEGLRDHWRQTQAVSAAFTCFETSPISALPARRGFRTAISLPMSAGVFAPVSASAAAMAAAISATLIFAGR